MSQNGANILKKPPKGHISYGIFTKFGKCIDIEEVLRFFFLQALESKLSKHESKATQTLKDINQILVGYF